MAVAVFLVAAASVLSACAAGPEPASGPPTVQDLTRAPAPIDCPASVGTTTDCLSGRDDQGAWYVIAMPREWNRRLIVHAHGGPRTGTPGAEDPLEDLDRFSIMVREGYAWVGSTYRRGGYGVRMAAEGVERSREAFEARFGRADRTLLHGQSWGGNVAAKTAELYPRDTSGRLTYDGVMLTNGVLNGGTRAYQFRADLRAVYQFYCRNHPSQADVAYPVWQGLPADSEMTRAELRQRIVDCTGVGLSMRERTEAQSRRLRDILAVTGIQESELVAHMNWATFLFQDLVQVRLGGRNPFDNSRTVYSGSSDDDALNAGVERFTADPVAVAMLAQDADLSGNLSVPTISLHALHDPTVSFAGEAAFADTVRRAGRSDLLVQVATDESDHSKLEDAGYLTVLRALEEWIQTSRRPDPDTFQARCLASEPATACRFRAG